MPQDLRHDRAAPRLKRFIRTLLMPRASLHYPSVDTFFIRPALISERSELEDLQLRASLNDAGDRDAILAHPDAIELPLQQIAGAGCSCQNRTAPSLDLQPWNLERMEKANWTHCLLIQECNVMGLDDRCSRTAPSSHEHKDLAPCT